MRGTPDINNFYRLVNILDKYFSEYIRLSGADNNGNCRCITCGKYCYWKDVDCGHYIGRKHLATRFNEMNCKPQCAWCNNHMEGQHFIFRKKLVSLYGEKKSNLWKRLRWLINRKIATACGTR